MKTNWDYTDLADAYLKRPEYASSAIDSIIEIAGLNENEAACDVGAGVAHLTLELHKRNLDVTAIEPNDAMRRNGIKRTEGLKIDWHEGTGENTGMESDTFRLVTFGSSFNVCDRQLALAETNRILKQKGWFACMWNHRNIETNAIQKEVESIIKSIIPSYGYGTRREDQTSEIEKCGLFHEVKFIEGTITHKQSIDGQIEAWKSHATLQRQAGDKFYSVIEKIETYFNSLNENYIDIDYTTRVWMAQAKK